MIVYLVYQDLFLISRNAIIHKTQNKGKVVKEKKRVIGFLQGR